jgi:1,4-dihydroxy-2-naphthoate polyprenyltransferase
MISVWLKAIRPKTLVASFVPVLVGSKEFLLEKYLTTHAIMVLLGCFLFSGLVQIATNLANDYFDSLKGADNIRKNAPKRMVSTGEISAGKMIRVTFVLLILAFGVGLCTLFTAGANFWFIGIGLLCLTFAVLYTAGPFALAYNGLGDVFVIAFFGLVAVEGTNYLMSCVTSELWKVNLALAFSVGLLINNLLVVNNYRDCEEDFRVGKRTTIVIFGKKIGTMLFVIGYLIPCIYALYNCNYLTLIIFFPSTLSLYFLIRGDNSKHFTRSLSLSALSIIIFGLTTLFY